ncbi:response regulator transcription factor [Bacteroides sp. KG68]|uniref:response regulator transcription factor n=1 Tax=unclassified Bacteroides TaxID=2646097 RepID=UPI003D7F84F3
MAEVKDFFIRENTIDYIPDEAYDNINYIIEDIDAFSHTTYKSVYVIDYFRQNFLYVSDNPLFLCGMTPEEVQVMGYNFYINQVAPEDLDLLLEINTAGFQFLQNIPTRELRDYTISYDFHIINSQSKKKWLINHQITPLRLTEKGQVWLAFCAASISSADKSGNIEMSKNKTKDLWIYNRSTKKWKEKPRPELKEVEKDVLKLSAMGYTMQEIADEVNRSFDTVKVYRKSLLEKLGVENIVEAINYAKNHKII